MAEGDACLLDSNILLRISFIGTYSTRSSQSSLETTSFCAITADG